jgi:hypothetical protein
MTKKLAAHIRLGVPALVTIFMAVIFNLAPDVNRLIICGVIALVINLTLFGIYIYTQRASFKSYFDESNSHFFAVVSVVRFIISVIFAYFFFASLLFMVNKYWRH